MQKVTGVGGVFFKAKDHKALMEWYKQHLGLEFQHGFIQLGWADDPKSATGSTTFSIFKEDAENFMPSEKPFMINFRVANLRALLAELKEAGVTVSTDIQEYDFGDFGWLVDPEGNKIELWEPKD